MKPRLPPVLPMTPGEAEDYKLHRRFDRMGRLVGDRKMQRLMSAHVLVVGLGGVGSFAAESLARSGVGTLTIVDFDAVCITNFNRQLHAIDGAVGKNKAEVMAQRLGQINRKADIRPRPISYDAEHAEQLLSPRPDFVIDAIDHVTSKCHLLATCRERAIPVVSATGSGGRLDPTQVKVADLAETTTDPLARAIRGILRTRYGFPAQGQP
ncbi:MAG: tRNA threonylcarbamoyladenosine dehydratase, partial [Myxococcota bacterium]